MMTLITFMGMYTRMLTSSSENEPRMAKNKKLSSHNVLNFVLINTLNFTLQDAIKDNIDTKKAKDDLQYSIY
jgi:hypothetical protein